jgi:hypothetical protein
MVEQPCDRIDGFRGRATGNTIPAKWLPFRRPQQLKQLQNVLFTATTLRLFRHTEQLSEHNVLPPHSFPKWNSREIRIYL